eukprot:scaffold99105_cov60-Phaeocystis_antarctica.AAC.4
MRSPRAAAEEAPRQAVHSPAPPRVGACRLLLRAPHSWLEPPAAGPPVVVGTIVSPSMAEQPLPLRWLTPPRRATESPRGSHGRPAPRGAPAASAAAGTAARCVSAQARRPCPGTALVPARRQLLGGTVATCQKTRAARCLAHA